MPSTSYAFHAAFLAGSVYLPLVTIVLIPMSLAISTSGVVSGFERDLFGKSVRIENNVPFGVYEGKALEELRCEMISYRNFYQVGITTYVWNKLFKKELLYPHQMNVDESISIGEDAAVTYPVIMNCKRVFVIDSNAYHYRQREDSMLKKNVPYEKELAKLRSLYKYLSAFAEKTDDKYQIQRQIDEFVLGICIMRSGGMLNKNGIQFSAYEKDFTNRRVVVYSAGTFGQQLVLRMKEKEHCSVVGWIDDDYWEYRRCCIDVDPIESITRIEFDYLLIATVNDSLAEKIKERLLKFGISKNKMLKVSIDRCRCNELIAAYLK